MVGQIIGVVGEGVLFVAGVVEYFSTNLCRAFQHTLATGRHICQRHQIAAAAAQFAARSKEENPQTCIIVNAVFSHITCFISKAVVHPQRIIIAGTVSAGSTALLDLLHIAAFLTVGKAWSAHNSGAHT